MSKLAIYAEKKDKLDRAIAKKTQELYIQGMGYKDAFKKAKEIYLERSC